MHGIQIKTETDKNYLVGGDENSPSKRERHKKVGNIEETKMNFFDPQKYGEALAPYEKAQED